MDWYAGTRCFSRASSFEVADCLSSADAFGASTAALSSAYSRSRRAIVAWTLGFRYLTVKGVSCSSETLHQAPSSILALVPSVSLFPLRTLFLLSPSTSHQAHADSPSTIPSGSKTPPRDSLSTNIDIYSGLIDGSSTTQAPPRSSPLGTR